MGGCKAKSKDQYTYSLYCSLWNAQDWDMTMGVDSLSVNCSLQNAQGLGHDQGS